VVVVAEEENQRKSKPRITPTEKTQLFLEPDNMMVKKMSRDKLAGDDEENRRDDVRRLKKNPPEIRICKEEF